MKPELVVAIKKLMSRRFPQVRSFYTGWFGGEPLVAKKVVLDVARHGTRLAQESGVDFSGGLTTNAYLLDKDLAEELIAARQTFYQITLDGFGATHDVTRRRADGHGTFDTIWRNLLSLKTIEASFTVALRIHVRRDNIENLRDLMIECARAFGSDRRFALNFQHVRDMGGENGRKLENPISYDELLVIEAELRKVFRAAVSRLDESAQDFGGRKEASLRMAPDRPSEDESSSGNAIARGAGESAGSRPGDVGNAGEPYICYAAKANSLLIRSNGRIGKCTVAFDDDRNDIGYLSDEGKIVISQEKLRPWLRGLETLDIEDVACPIKHMDRFSRPSPFPETHKSVVVLHRRTISKGAANGKAD